MNQQEFGYELARTRKSKGLTQSELAEKSGLSKRTIQRLESGLVTPRGYTLKALSAALDFDFLKELPNGLAKNEVSITRFILINSIIKQTVDLFNLKTNAMRKLSILTVIFGLTGIGIFTISNNSIAQTGPKFTDFGVMDSITEISQKEAIKAINEVKQKATFHNVSIDLIKSYAEKSNYNYDTYVLLSKLIGSFGYSTKPAMEIANIVFLTNKDCDLFNEIVPLIFLNNHNVNNYVNLARDASVARSEADKDKIRDQISKYREHGDFKTLVVAFNKQGKI